MKAFVVYLRNIATIAILALVASFVMGLARLHIANDLGYYIYGVAYITILMCAYRLTTITIRGLIGIIR